eukprot:TRINITY_DN29934_c0_g2_i1.p1 TRINITY_DN29934_c0_g2~~TRINITY_DN29934_c0_g2_i1.p1  ORF type:complete len:795 (-),score=114.55 TRINITY_DN29934_c0_g2_i1:54-2438(-)
MTRAHPVQALFQRRLSRAPPSQRGVLVRSSTLEVPKIQVHSPGQHPLASPASDSQAIVAFHGPRMSLVSAASSALPVSQYPSSRQSVEFGTSRRPSILRQGTAPASLYGNKGDVPPIARLSLTSRPSIMKNAMGEGRDRRLSAPESEIIFMVHAVWDHVDGFMPSQPARTSRRRSQFLGEEVAIVDEQKRQIPKFFDKFIAHPSALKVMLWDFLGLMLIFYDCVSVPLEVFGFQPESQPVTLAFEWIIRIFWTLNFAGCFLTGYMKTDGSIELQFDKVLRHYLLTWFTFDFFVVFFDWAEVMAGVAASNVQSYVVPLRTARLVRTVRLARLLKAPEITKKITEHLPFPEHLAVIGELAKIMGLCLWVAHLIACAWFGIGHIGQSNSETSWIDLENIYEMTGPDQYCRSFHWAMAVFSGDSSLVPPQNNYERVFVTLTLFLAFLFSAWYVGRITTSMTRLQIITSEQSTKLAVLRRFLLDHNISRQLAVRVQRNAQFAMREQKSKAPEKSVELLKVISPPVLMEVHYEIHSKVLNLHPFFLYYNEVNPAGIRKVCHVAIEMLSLSQGDVLFSELEAPPVPRMFFVVAGRFNYLKGDSAIPVQEDQWMSEAGLWTSRWTHCGTAKAITETRLLTLHADRFQDIVSTYPSAHASLYSMEFVEWLNDRPKDELSDTLPDKEETLNMINQAFPEDSDTESEENVDRRDSKGQWFAGRSAFVKKFSDRPGPGHGGRSSGQSGGARKKRSSDRGSQSEKGLHSILSRLSAGRLSRHVTVMFQSSVERHSACSPRASSANGG